MIGLQTRVHGTKQTSLSGDATPLPPSEGSGNASPSADSRMQSCGDRVIEALANYDAILEEVGESMSASGAANSTVRLRHSKARAATALAIEQMAACVPSSLADLAGKQAVLVRSQAFCADNSWLEGLVHQSTFRDIAHLTKSRKSAASWLPPSRSRP